MITLRNPLLLLLSFSICASVWYILAQTPQEKWLRHRCAVLSRGWPPKLASVRNPFGCMLRTYSANDIRACLSHQRMTIYGDTEAHQMFSEIAEVLDQRRLTNASAQRVADHGNATVLESGAAQIAFEPAPTWNLTARVYDSNLYAPYYIESLGRQSPLSNPPAIVLGSAFAFKEYDSHSPSAEAQLVLNYLCNGLIDAARRQTQAYCCTGYVAPNALQKLLLFAGSCSVVFYLCAGLLRGRHFHSLDDKSQLVAEARHVMIAIATISGVVVVCFVADRTALLQKASKRVDLTAFLWLAVISLLSGLATVGRSQPTSVFVLESKDSMPERRQLLSRQQTEEWKGWMQIVILLYHYLGVSKVLWVYQFVRLLVSSYLFMTGFGHSTYFITTNDFSFRRAAIVLFRNNLLNVILAYVLGTHYDLYYFPVVTSVWFLIVWATIPHTPEAGVNARHCLSRMVISAMAVRLALEAGSVVQPSLNSLGGMRLGLPKIDGREFFFRFGLDVYIVYVGMATAILAAWLQANDELQHHNLSWMPSFCSRLGPKLTVSAATVVVPAYALICHSFSNKFEYNAWHPVVSPFPVIAFLILRNSTRQLSSYHSLLFAWFGRCSLETFVLQYHIWLAADSQGILRLGLFKYFDGSSHGSYMLETLETILIFVIFVAISSAASKALSVLTRSLVDLQAKLVLTFAALWTVNLAWSFSVLGQHEYYY